MPRIKPIITLAVLLVSLVGFSGGLVVTGQHPLAGTRAVHAAGADAWARMPVGLRAAASAVIGASQPAWRVVERGGRLVASGGGVRSSFDRGGVSLGVASGSARLALAGVGRGRRLTAVMSAAPVAWRNSVAYRRGGVVEWYRSGPLGLEQGFTLERRPAGGSGQVAIGLRVGGSLRAGLTHGELVFLTRGGRVALRYGGLSAVDAAGRWLLTHMELRDGLLILSVADARARYPLRVDPFIQQGAKLTGIGETGSGISGFSVALSADGNTALIGGPGDNTGAGTAWVFTRSGSTWTQQGSQLTGSGETGAGDFGQSVALSADGNTALIGGVSDNGFVGAAWVFIRFGSAWTRQGSKLTGTGETGGGQFGDSVALSADGNTALIGGPGDNGTAGAAWVFTRFGSLLGPRWTQQGSKLTGTGETGGGQFGNGVALSADGNTALIGGPGDNGFVGAAWVFIRSGSSWTQHGSKLTGTGEAGGGFFGGSFGYSVALSADGNTALIGGPADNGFVGAAWVFTRSGPSWTQQGSKLTSTAGAAFDQFGNSAALSADGSTALIGGFSANSFVGAAWVFTGSGSSWTQQGSELTGSGETGAGQFGSAVALSADGSTALIGGPYDNSAVGAAWVFGAPRVASPPGLAFGSQTVGQAGPALWLPVSNSGQAPLAISGPAQIVGSGDFTIPTGGDLCNGVTLAPGYTCWIGVQFKAATTGTRTGTLSLGANDGLGPAPTVALTGTGMPPNSGPQGPSGPPGLQGPAGATGPRGPAGAAGQVELITCTTVTKIVKGNRRKLQQCTGRLVSGPLKFTAAAAAARATISRGPVIYATGVRVQLGDGHTQLLVSQARPIHPGRYTLTIRTRRHNRLRIRQQTIQIG